MPERAFLATTRTIEPGKFDVLIAIHLDDDGTKKIEAVKPSDPKPLLLTSIQILEAPTVGSECVEWITRLPARDIYEIGIWNRFGEITNPDGVQEKRVMGY